MLFRNSTSVFVFSSGSPAFPTLSSSQGWDSWISTAGLMTWSQHIQSPFPCIEGKSYFFTFFFFCHRERCKYASVRMCFMFPIDGKDGHVFLSMCSFDVVCRLVLSPVLSWIWTRTKCYWEINSVLGGKSVATALAIAYGCLFEKHCPPAVIWGQSSIFQVSQLHSHPHTAGAAPGAALRCWTCWDSRSCLTQRYLARQKSLCFP